MLITFFWYFLFSIMIMIFYTFQPDYVYGFHHDYDFLYTLHQDFEKMRNMNKSLLLKRIALRALKNWMSGLKPRNTMWDAASDVTIMSLHWTVFLPPTDDGHQAIFLAGTAPKTVVRRRLSFAPHLRCDRKKWILAELCNIELYSDYLFQSRHI